jgi:hypothetical protein
MKKLLTLVLLAGIVLFPGCGSDKSTQVSVLPDDAPPLTPTGLSSQVEQGSAIAVTWSPNTESDLAGYRVYLYDPSPQRDTSYVLQNPDALLTSERWLSAMEPNQVIWVRVTAVDANGNESATSGPARVFFEGQPTVSPAPPVRPPVPTTDPLHPGK